MGSPGTEMRASANPSISHLLRAVLRRLSQDAEPQQRLGIIVESHGVTMGYFLAFLRIFWIFWKNLFVARNSSETKRSCPWYRVVRAGG